MTIKNSIPTLQIDFPLPAVSSSGIQPIFLLHPSPNWSRCIMLRRWCSLLSGVLLVMFVSY